LQQGGDRIAARKRSPSLLAKVSSNAPARFPAGCLHQKIDTVVYELQSLAAQEQEGLQKTGPRYRRSRGELENHEREWQLQLGPIEWRS